MSNTPPKVINTTAPTGRVVLIRKRKPVLPVKTPLVH